MGELLLATFSGLVLPIALKVWTRHYEQRPKALEEFFGAVLIAFWPSAGRGVSGPGTRADVTR